MLHFKRIARGYEGCFLVAPMKFQDALIVGLSLVATEASAQLMTPVRAGAETAIDAARPLGKLDCLNNRVRIHRRTTPATRPSTTCRCGSAPTR